MRQSTILMIGLPWVGCRIQRFAEPTMGNIPFWSNGYANVRLSDPNDHP